MEKNIDVGNDEIFSQQERENILEKVKSFYENKLAEKGNYVNEVQQINSERSWFFNGKKTLFYFTVLSN